MRVGLGFASWECLYKVGIRHMAQSMIRNEIVFLRGLLCGLNVSRTMLNMDSGFQSLLGFMVEVSGNGFVLHVQDQWLSGLRFKNFIPRRGTISRTRLF